MFNLSIVIVTYNSSQTIQRCIEALPDGPEIICIDNASVDETVRTVRRFDRVCLIQNSRNVGFSAGCNQGLAHSKGNHLLFLNPDAFVKPGTIKSMDSVLAKASSNIAGVGPKLISSATGPDNERVIDSAGICLNRKALSPYDLGHGQYDRGQYDHQSDFFGPSCACAMFRKTALEQLAVEGEVFDEDFFAYYEDVDLAWRAHLFGYNFLFVPDALVEHDRKNPQDKQTPTFARAFVNRYFCAIKNDPHLSGYFPSTFVREMLRLTYHIMTKPGFDFALSFLFSNLMKMVEKRSWIQARRAIDSDAIKAFAPCL